MSENRESGGRKMADTPDPQDQERCCSDLEEALAGNDFEPLLTVGTDGIVYMSIGLVEFEDEDQPGIMDHPMFFCPFCGAEVQSREAVEAAFEAADHTTN